MPISKFIIRLSAGDFFAGFRGGIPTRTPDQAKAKSFDTRLSALGAAAAGPASIFDHSAIEPYSPQDAPGAPDAGKPSPKGQNAPQGDKDAEV